MHPVKMTPQKIFVDHIQHEVPAFQRRYRWTQEQQWEPLWEDVSGLAESIIETGHSDPHFVGAVVLLPLGGHRIGRVNKRSVVDGQQRLITLQLLLDAVREVCQQRGHSSAAERLRDLVEIPERHRHNSANPDDAFKVWPTLVDRGAFRQAMRNDLSRGEFKNSRVVAAHNYFKNQTELWLQGKVADQTVANEGVAADSLDEAVRTRLELVVIELEKGDDPHIIFETSTIGVINPVLLWLLSSEVPIPQLSKSITALESYLVRRMACAMNARTYGQVFVRLLRELEESSPEYAGDTVVRYLDQQTVASSKWPSDQELLEAFATSPLYWSLTKGRINLILEGIEGELRTRSMTETQEVPRNLQIEHIMPQSWPSHWPLPSDTADEERASASRERLIQSIGNLTLVDRRLNSALSNAPWEQKRETLAQHSRLFLNKVLLDNAPPVWDESAIALRAQQLHQAAVRVWPRLVPARS